MPDVGHSSRFTICGFRGAGRVTVAAGGGGPPLLLDALDVRADGGELLFDLFVPAIDVVDAVDAGGAAGDHAGQDQGGRGAEVAGHDACALHLLDALDDGGGAFLSDAGAHSVEFTDVEE